jgi:hypothetical protein
VPDDEHGDQHMHEYGCVELKQVLQHDAVPRKVHECRSAVHADDRHEEHERLLRFRAC